VTEGTNFLTAILDYLDAFEILSGPASGRGGFGFEITEGRDISL
jgi:hypothetical protein